MASVLVVGSSVVDFSFYAERIPRVGETLRGRFARWLGGKGFNQALSAALSGSPTRFVSAVGEDPFAAEFEPALDAAGIEHALERIPATATGAASIWVDAAGRNSIIVAPGANAALSRGFLERREDLFEDVAVLLLQLETNLEAVEAAIALARKKNPGVIVVLNPAPAVTEIPPGIVREVDFLTPNEAELASLSGCALPDATDAGMLREACAAISNHGAVLATVGEHGCFYYRESQGHAESAALPAFAVPAVDTTGAGDAFNGAFASGLLRYGGDWRAAALFASAAAAISVTRAGTAASMATLREIDEMLAGQGYRDPGTNDRIGPI